MFAKAAGDQEACDASMKAASRSVAVIGGGVAGCIVAGPAGAVAGGVAAGATMDGITYGVDKAGSNSSWPPLKKWMATKF